MRFAETVIDARDGTNLFVRSYSPDESCDRWMVILHGTSEYGGRYDHVARVAVEQGWNVIAPDLRGHGHSGGAPVHTDRFERYLTDLDAIWTHFKLNPDRTVLVGHSFGGLVSIRFAQTRPTRLQALVLSSPLLGLLVKIGSLKLALGRLASILRPETRFRSTVPPEHTCHDPEVLSRRMADPLMHRSITAAWFFQMKRALHDAWKDAARLEIPILALQAGDDLIVDPAAVEPWIQTTATRDPVFRMITGAYHEVFNEPDWRDTLDETLTWLDELVPCVTAEG